MLFLCITAIILVVCQNLLSQAAVTAMGGERAEGYTLILDAGHGGLDGGAVAADGTRESELNLAIALRAEALARLAGIPVIMTRTGEDLDYPEENLTVRQKKVWDQNRRLSLIEDQERGVLISVHQNTYPDSRPSGTEVLYAKTSGSKELAEGLHGELIRCLNPENRRVAMPISDSIYLMKKARCTAVLVECGFLSNAAEAERLKTADYQKKLAVVLIGSYLNYISSIQTEVYQ